MKKMKSFRILLTLAAAFLFAAFSTFGQTAYTQLQSSSSNMITTTYSASKSNNKDFAVQAVVTVNTPAAVTFTCVAATDVCTSSSAHGFTTGLKTQASTTTTLPAGLSTSTDYFPIVLTSTTFKLATSLANAQAGTAINLTDAGTGTHTITPTSLAGASIKLQGSIDCVNFTDISGSSTSVTATASLLWSMTSQTYRCVRAASTLTAGMMKADIYYTPSPQ